MSDASTSPSSSELLDSVTPMPMSRSVRKRPRSSNDFFDLLNCPICFDYYTPPIINCKKGHSFCINCIERMERTSGDLRCPQCRSPIDKTSRNHLIEDQLEKITVGCIWREYGCKARISLTERENHEKTCEKRPGGVFCYFAHEPLGNSCNWKGNPLQLPKHLEQSHDIQPIERGRIVKFLWNPPRQDQARFRHRVIKIGYPSESNKTYFILEHIYIPDCKQLLFMVRTLDSEVKIPYKISILNRSDDENKISFRGKTADFEDIGLLSQYPNIDKTKIFAVHYDTLQNYSFQNIEDGLIYFSLHIEFLSAGYREVVDD